MEENKKQKKGKKEKTISPALVKRMVQEMQGRSFGDLTEILRPLESRKSLPLDQNVHPDCIKAGVRAVHGTENGMRSILADFKENPEEFVRDLFNTEKIEDLQNARDRGEIPAPDEWLMDKTRLKLSLAEKKWKKLSEETSARIDHAVKVLKRKGYYAESEEELYAKAGAKGYAVIHSVIEYIHALFPHYLHKSKSITEKAWRAAIEIVMLIEQPELLDDSSQYLGIFVEQHAEKIQVFAMIFAWLEDFTTVFFNMMNWADDMNAVCAIVGGLDNLIGAITWIALKDIDADHKNEEAYKQNLERLQQSHKTREKELYDKIKALEKAEPGLQSENQKLAARVAELEEALKAKTAQIEEILDASWDETGAIEIDSLPPLPETGVVFIGGHPNMTKHLRNAFPNWKFINGDTVGFQTIGNPDFLCFWTGHLCHPAFHKAISQRPKNCRVIYCAATNREKLQDELRCKFHQALSGS